MPFFISAIRSHQVILKTDISLVLLVLFACLVSVEKLIMAKVIEIVTRHEVYDRMFQILAS